MLDSLTINIEFHLRLLTGNDAEQFKQIRDANLEYLHDDTSYSLIETEQYLNGGDIRFYGIFTAYNKLIGYIRFNQHSDLACYIGMDLHPKYQSQGLGFDLYKAVITNIVASSPTIEYIYLRVLDTNARAFQLYYKLGFTVIDENNFAVTRKNGNVVGDCLMMYSVKHNT